MASSSSCRPRFTSVMPHFFKVILTQTLTQGMLDVPKKFVRKHKEAFRADEVRLKVASGAQWKVGLTKRNEKVWFEKGWEEFVKFYSIQFGHFLTFRYEGNFGFHVTIFDQSASEIDYPIAFGEFQIPQKSESEEFEDDESVQILGNNKRIRREDEITQTLNSFADKMMKKLEDLHYSSDLKFKDLEAEKVMKLENCVRKQTSNESDEQQGRSVISKRAATFKSKSRTTNPCFMVKIGSSYIHSGRSNLCIPKAFGNMHMKESCKEIILQIPNGRVWKIVCGVRTGDNNKFEMRGGWRAFARDNNLEKGDLCVFELIKTTPPLLFQVATFRFTSSQ